MKVIIVGAGNVGTGIARRLSADGHSVIMIERDERRVEEIRESVDADVRLGDGASILSLVEAGVRSTDLLLAVGDNDESNVIASLVASKLGVRRTIARVRNVEFYVNPDVISSKDDLGVDLMINPEVATATEITRLLQHSAASDFYELGGGKLQFVGLPLDDPDLDIYERPLAELGTAEQRARLRIVAIDRGDGKIIVPTGLDQFHLGDHVYFIARSETSRELLRAFGKRDEEASHIVIFGANQIGRLVAQKLSRLRKQVILYDDDEHRVEQAALALPGALVNLGDGTEAELHEAEEFGANSAAVCVGDEEERNILIGLLAKRAGAGKVIVLVRRPHYANLVTAMGIDSAVNPHLVTVSEVLRFVRGDNVLSLTTLKDGQAEVLQFVAARGQPAVGVPLRELDFPTGCLIGGLIKEGRAVIPTGDSVIEHGDVVIAFCLRDSTEPLQAMFRG